VKLGIITREDYRIRVFEKREFRIIFVPQRCGWIKMFNEELFNLFCTALLAD
jgi:hypothetical protein